MILLDNTLVSLDLFEKYFFCNLKKCSGICCVEGDAGAPLEDEEVGIIEKLLEEIKPFMSKPALDLLEKEDFYLKEDDAGFVTNCINGRECIFVYKKNRINYCTIERSWMEKKIDFQKPISCHLYPVRLYNLKDLVAVNYNKWDICDDALVCGKSKKIPLYVFLKDALIRRFGKTWYDEIVRIAVEYKNSGF